MNDRLRVMITGASSGIGLETAREFARRGARLVITARRGQKLEELAAELRAAGTEVHVVPADLLDRGTPTYLIEQTIQRLGGLDILVNNAGYGLPTLFHDSNPEDLRRQIEVNLVAPILTTRAALAALEASRGMVINIGSSLSVAAIPAFGVYGMTKAALAYWNDAIRRELQPRGIRVCLVEPGPISTEFFDVVEQAAGDRELPSWLKRPPAALSGRPDDAARRIATLATRPRRRISMLRRTVWPLRVLGGLVRLFPGVGDAFFRPKPE
ncbi:MAG: SDR family NAD(P)-dependent oxidoreductase [Isosphaeraceae bacterium]|nr:SDR family NAD(P)-dependent oxidoreductase [Isosphaeraceae bacterium]